MKALMKKPPGSLPRTWTMHLILSTPSISNFPTDQSLCSGTNLFLTHLIYIQLFSPSSTKQSIFLSNSSCIKERLLFPPSIFVLTLLLLVGHQNPSSFLAPIPTTDYHFSIKNPLFPPSISLSNSLHFTFFFFLSSFQSPRTPLLQSTERF